MTIDLIQELEKCSLSEKKNGRAKCSVHQVWGHPEIEVKSWKFNEWDYFKESVKLPTRARGLFTIGDKIVLRGYDKFFSMDEVPYTKWDALEQETEGPYFTTVKENGCLVLIGGFEGKLIVTSKHSSGPHEGQGKNHALAGYNWVREHLKRAGRSEKDFAEELEANNLTAVGELCDDSFEEHVLAYPSEQAGIYLTGLNYNTADFATKSPDTVALWARKFGFNETEFLVQPSLQSLRSFLEKSAQDGLWKDRGPVEGFVVRCRRLGADFFFKYKFEEPYHMYRQWREITFQYLSHEGNPEATMNAPRVVLKHRESSIRYLQFAIAYLKQHPGLLTRIRDQKQGIIELRDKFLDSAGMSPEELLELGFNGIPKYVLEPVATIGCGKTTIAVALSELMGWPHIQNDSLSGKSKRTEFVKRLANALDSSDVVIADRNNHMRRERQQLHDDLVEATGFKGYALRFVCLNFLPRGPTKDTKLITRERVGKRGGNHQTIRDMSDILVDNVMKGFEGRFQVVDRNSGPPDSLFDLIIDLDVVNSDWSLQKIINSLEEKYNLGPQCTVNTREALEKAFKYKPVLPVAGNEPKKQEKLPPPEYFAIKIDPTFVHTIELPAEWRDAVLRPEFHVTLAHYRAHKELWKKYRTKFASQLKSSKKEIVDLGAYADVCLLELCWNDDLLVIRVSTPAECGNAHPHITLACRNGSQPKDSNAMLENPHSTRLLNVNLTRQVLFAKR